jgi:outer membrane protein assembly factor BamB
MCSLVLGCGPGGFAGDGEGFGSGGSDTADDGPGEPSTSMSEPGDPSSDTSLDTATSDESETETETETGANDWTDPETETDTDEPEPIDANCTRVWTHLDTWKSHGHLGATPIGPGPNGGFVSVTPVLASLDAVNVDARIRSWSPDGDIVWDEQLSWGDHRDDPLALLSDELGDLFLGGRINANTFEDAMVSKLDGASGEPLWIFLRGEAGGYTSIAHNGAALVVAGMIGSVADPLFELMALEPETGDVLWTAELESITDIVATRGLVVADGRVDVLVARPERVDILRFDPPASTESILTNLIAFNGSVAAQDLERFGDDRLAALYNNGDSSYLAIVDRETGELGESWKVDVAPSATTVLASELVELPGGTGLGIAGTVEIAGELLTFVLRLDAELNPVCFGLLGAADLGLAWGPELRGLVVGDDGALYTGGYLVDPRNGVFARWD